MRGKANSLLFHASRRNLFLAFIPVFFTSLSPWNGNLTAENMAIENILWEWVLVGMTTVNGLSLCGVRVVAPGKLMMVPFGLVALWPLSYVTNMVLGIGKLQNGTGVGAMVGRVSCHRSLEHMVEWILLGIPFCRAM